MAPILGDIDGAIAEITRAHGEGLWGGVIIPAQWGKYPSYTNYRYDPIWELCESLSLPVHTHSGPAAHDDYGAVPGVLGLYATETVWWTSRPMWFLLWSGVFERFPKLKMAVTESGSYWAPDMLWRMDSLILKDQGSRKLDDSVKGLLTMLPSEYFDRNCGLGSSNTRRRELARRYEIGIGNIMWGNDFPHPEGTWPYTKKILREAFWDIPVDETAQILGLNAAEFYGFDVGALRPSRTRSGRRPRSSARPTSRCSTSGTTCAPPGGIGSAVGKRYRSRPETWCSGRRRSMARSHSSPVEDAASAAASPSRRRRPARGGHPGARCRDRAAHRRRDQRARR